MAAPMIRQLNIANYETHIVLGNNEYEKHEKRKIIIDISLRFSEKVNACLSDDIDDTVCYAKLINFLEDKLQNAKFNLIERTVQFLYDEISAHLNDESIQKHIKVAKISPPIENLESVSFICSDW
jgi:dihydroneopterin aldolase